MKKILFVINTMGLAGAEKSLIALLKSIDYNRCSVSLFSIINRGELFSEVPPQVNILNKNPSPGSVHDLNGVWYIAGKTFIGIIRHGLFKKSFCNVIKNIILKFKSGYRQISKLLWHILAETAPVQKDAYDLAIAFIEGAATYYVAESVKSLKKIAFVHINYEKAGYIKQFDARYYNKMDYICCVSKAVKEAFLGVYPEHAKILRVFPNIVLKNNILKAADEPGGFVDSFEGLRILSVGRLHYQKGFDAAIPAFGKLVNNEKGYDNIRWYVLGGGGEKRKLRELIRRHGLDGKFILLGPRRNPCPYIKQCDIFAHFSRYEGFPVSLTEAVILNKPCMITNFEGASDFFTDGENALMINFSENNILSAIKKMVGDEALRARISEAVKRLEFPYQNKVNLLYDIMEGAYWEENI